MRAVVLAAILVTAVAMPAVTAERVAEKDPNLIWSDEFDGTALDVMKWEYRQLGLRRDAVNSKEAVSLDGNGHLVLTTRKSGGRLETGMIGTQGKFERAFGYFECRVKLQTQEGHWSAFWLQSPRMGEKAYDPANDGAEIDIFEYLAKRGDKIQHTLHWGGYGEKHRSASRVHEQPGLREGWHTVGLDWTEAGYVFYVDGKESWRTGQGVSRIAQYIIISLEVGTWGGDIAKASLPDSVLFDYVRVYKVRPSGSDPAATSAQGAEGTSVFADDFETPSARNPPAGWAMWGAQQFKVPANYTRDTSQRHGGQASFRIHHPARTRGYIVSAPERAIRPRRGMIYTASFWARAEKAGDALFQWTAYRSIRPFVDAPSPGSMSFKVDREWRSYTCSIREGLDLFADESRFLLLTFHSTGEPAEEQTLWIDDVRVSEQVDPSPVELLNAATIPHATLEHRLRPGDRLEFTVSAADRSRRATADAGGVSFHRVCGWTGQPYDRKGVYTLRPEMEEAIRELRLPMTRFYGVGDEPFGVESAIDKVADACRRVGVEQDHCVLELEEQGASRKLAPETWARGVSHAMRRGYRFRHWEIANEPYASLWGHGGAFPTPDDFIVHFKAVTDAIRRADPKAQIGVDIYAEQVRWGNYVLRQLAGYYDFVAPHYYCGADVRRSAFEDIALTENYRMLDRALRMNALLRAYNGDRPVYQYDTEWGMICGTADGKEADYEDRNANIIGTVHRAVRLIYYAREDIVRGAGGWQMLSRPGGQGFGILSQEAPDKRFMLYWLYYYFNRHVGEWVVPIDGTGPFHPQGREAGEFVGPLTPVVATLSGDGRQLYLVMVNGSWTRAVPCRVTLRDFRADRAVGVVISSDKLNGKPLLEKKEDAVSDLPVKTTGDEVTCTLPPHAVMFATLARE